MEKYLYYVFETCAINNCPDLNIALAMFFSDITEGKQEYGPKELDYGALHKDLAALTLSYGRTVDFIHRHYARLVRAYSHKDKDIFDAEVELCRQADEAREAARLAAEDAAAQSEEE